MSRSPQTLSQLGVNCQLRVQFDWAQSAQGWELQADSRHREGYFQATLAPTIVGSYYSDPHQGRVERPDFIESGAQLTRIMAELHCGGQRHAEAILRNSHYIPPEWQKYMLAFPETLWQPPQRFRCPGADRPGPAFYPVLQWCGTTWMLSFASMWDWHRNIRMLRISPS